nr:DAK2 domain-containing protein [uncultured Desulfobacter sp.]
MFRAGVDGIVQRGRPSLGDKTMFDAWAPALDAMHTALSKGCNILTIVKPGPAAIDPGMKNTIALHGKKDAKATLANAVSGTRTRGRPLPA